LRVADKDDISYSDFVTRLVRAQFQARQEGALEWRIQRAKLPERWTLETFPFARQPGVNRKQIRGFAELEFIASADRLLAAQLYQRGLSLKVIENAFVLAATRRLNRPSEAPPLGTIRSLAYFLPVIEEVLESRVSPDYFEYLRHKLIRTAPPR
jgi:IstB-like ATP binding protein